jgi:hypothetical protein
MAAYPSSIFPWTPRINNVNIVWAADPNSLAAEIQAIESIIGTNPNIEPDTPSGIPVTYPTVSARISGAFQGQQVPYCLVVGKNVNTLASQTAALNVYYKASDEFEMWNGSDLTIPFDGWYVLTHQELWDAAGNRPNGLVASDLMLNGGVTTRTQWRFDYPLPDTSWDIMGNYGYTTMAWQGLLHAGDRVQVRSVNGTNEAMKIDYIDLHAVMIRQVPASPGYLTG